MEQLSAKNVILNEHLDGALTETTQNLDALKQAVAANAHHENILTKQEENIKTLRTKCGMDPKNVGATQM
ncbi:MAG: hypothetical protein V2I33_25595 [Kangiellaceae bacterium]|nr:hypothetical protein [Kangiellaceae bacterium]